MVAMVATNKIVCRDWTLISDEGLSDSSFTITVDTAIFSLICFPYHSFLSIRKLYLSEFSGKIGSYSIFDLCNAVIALKVSLPQVSRT